jgi:hypothetical protein
MPFNGTGIFQRVYQWTNDAANGLDVDATRTDTDSNDIADGLTNCITRDGQSPALANLPMATFKLTGLGNGSSTADSVNYGQVFNSPAFVTPSATTSPASSDNSLFLATTAMVQQVAFAAVLPAATLGLLTYDGSTTNFRKSLAFGLNEAKAAAVASAATPDIWSGNGNTMHITGTTGITSFVAAPQAGARRRLLFDGIVTLTNSANLNLPNAQNYTTAAGDVVEVYADTTTTFYLTITPATGRAPVATGYLQVREEQTSGTSGGTAASGSITRTLNTVVGTNTIAGASLASNIVTLPAGTYDFRAIAPFGTGSGSGGPSGALTLYNNTDSANILTGPNAVVLSGTSPIIYAPVEGRFVLTTTKGIKLIQAALTGMVLGSATGAGTEVYSTLQLWKVA